MAELDSAAREQLITRSQLIAQLIREWADRRRKKAGGAGKAQGEAG